MAHCHIRDQHCKLAHGTVIWGKVTDKASACRYVVAAESVAYVTPKHVVFDNIQTAFTYKNVTYRSSQLSSWCLDTYSVPMDNGVFISLPEIKDYHPRTIFSGFPNKVKEINQRHSNVSKVLYSSDSIYQEKMKSRRIRSPMEDELTNEDSNPDLGDIIEPWNTEPKSTRSLRLRLGKSFSSGRGKRSTLGTGTHRELSAILFRTKPNLLNKFAANDSKAVARHLAMNIEPDFTKLNSDSSLTHEQRQDQRQYELNSKMQYLKAKFDEIVKHDFNFLFDRICSLTNFKIQAIRSIAQINPTSAARILLNREDIYAIPAGDILMVSKCKQVQVDEVYYLDHSVNGICYFHTPVRIGKSIYFVEPGTRD